MGGKHARKGQHLFLYCSVFIATTLIAAGCASVKQRYDLAFSGAQNELSAASRLMGAGAYDEALRISETVLRDHPDTLGDRALFQMGLIFADPQNPKQDIPHAMELFARLKGTYPKSELVGQAKLWMRALTVQTAEQDKIRQLTQEVGRSSQALKDQKLQIDRLTDQIGQANLKLEDLNTKFAEMQEKNRKLEEQITQMKDIELNIQQKKEKVQ
jgi:chromosome condensin MukBEF ATPase and DNA-binding subunit MukB